MEWPKGCDYWKRREVVRELNRHCRYTTIFNGCMYGLVSTIRSTKGRPISKPWKLACSHKEMTFALDKRCYSSECCARTGTPHVTCHGQDTRLSEEYTDEIVHQVHDNFRGIVETRVQESSKVPLDPKPSRKVCAAARFKRRKTPTSAAAFAEVSSPTSLAPLRRLCCSKPGHDACSL